MPVGQDEAVAVGPVGLGRVVAHDPGEQDVGQRCQGHGRAGMAGVGGPRGVHGQSPDDVDPELLEGAGVGRVPGGRRARASLRPPYRPRATVVDVTDADRRPSRAARLGRDGQTGRRFSAIGTGPSRR